jgi:uncharacterized protein
MTKRPYRALLDTNIWISAFINPSGQPAHLLYLFFQGHYQMIASQALLDEITNVLIRPRIRRNLRIPDSQIAIFLSHLQKEALMVNPTGHVHLCRDPKDDILLETAILGSADFIVSRDDDMKRDLTLITRLREYGVEAVSISHFIDILTQQH